MSTKSKTKSTSKKKAVSKKPAAKAPAARKSAAKKATQLPGNKLAAAFQTAKVQTKALISAEFKRLTTAKKAVASYATKLKQTIDNLKKLEAKHKTKPSKSVANQINSTKSKVKQAELAAAKAHSSCEQVTQKHAGYNNHLKKLEHLHKLVATGDREWQQENSANKTGTVKKATKRTVHKQTVKPNETKTEPAQHTA